MGSVREWRRNAAGKGERRGEKKNNGASETFIVKQCVLGSWLLLGLLQEQTFLGGEGGYRISLPIGSRRIGHGECEQKGKFALNLRGGGEPNPKPNNTPKKKKMEVLTLCGEVAAKLAGWSRGLVGMNGLPGCSGCPAVLGAGCCICRVVMEHGGESAGLGGRGFERFLELPFDPNASKFTVGFVFFKLLFYFLP